MERKGKTEFRITHQILLDREAPNFLCQLNYVHE